MALLLPGGEGNAAPGAEGRLDPMDAGMAVRADPLFSLGQKRFAAIALRGQKKLEEAFKKKGHSF